jgi:predicted phosphodiesterase
MRIAVLADIHANLVALEAVMETIAAEGVERVVCLGDLATLGPAPNRTLDLLRVKDWLFVRGNHDHYLHAPELVAQHTDAEIVHHSVNWCRNRLSAPNRAFLEDLAPAPVRFDCCGHTLVFCHGSPRSDLDDMLADTEPDELGAMLSGVPAAHLVAGGHTHVPMTRRHGATLVVNAGSVGLPFEAFAGGGPPRIRACAEYAVIVVSEKGVSARLRQLALNPDALRTAASRSGNPLCRELERQYAGLAAVSPDFA